MHPHSDWDWDEPMTEISAAAKLAVASPRVATLADSKHTHSCFVPCRDVQWKVRRASLSHVASELTDKLSKPKSHRAAQEDYNPRAWCVSRTTLTAHASPRLSELATPPARKIRAKTVS